MAPDVEPRNVPGRRKRNPRAAQVPKLPASVVTMASSGSRLRSEVTTLPGCTPGPLHGCSSTTVAASHAARSSALRTARASVLAASSTPRVSRRATAARRNSRASEVMVIAGAGRSSGRLAGAMSTYAQRVPGAGIDQPYVVISPSREPITSNASAASSRARTVGGEP